MFYTKLWSIVAIFGLLENLFLRLGDAVGLVAFFILAPLGGIGFGLLLISEELRKQVTQRLVRRVLYLTKNFLAGLVLGLLADHQGGVAGVIAGKGIDVTALDEVVEDGSAASGGGDVEERVPERVSGRWVRLVLQ